MTGSPLDPTLTTVPPSVIKVYGTPAKPRYSVAVVQGTTAADLDALIDLALDAFDAVGQRHADRRERRRRDAQARAEEYRR